MICSMRASARAILIWVVFSLLGVPGSAQELSPRAYWPAPRGTKLVILGLNYSTGDILTDPSLPVVGLDSRISTGLAGYLQTLSLGGRTANLIVEVPYVWGTASGDVEGEPRRREIAGLADIAVTLSANLLGAPSMSPEEFQALRKNPHPILGASLKVVAPIGNYESDKLINVGANRWTVKVEMGTILPMKPKWLLEIELGASFFGDNDEFLGVTREQKPIFATEIHLVKRFTPGFWAALDLNFFTGGRSTIGGEVRADLQRNSRIGVTLVYPFGRRHAIKAGYSIGVVTESGGDFQMFLLGYLVRL